MDVSASVNEDGILSLAVVNVSETEDFETELSGVGKNVEVYTVTGKDVNVVNEGEKQEVGIVESKWDGTGKYKFGKHSFTMLRWDTEKKIADVKKGDGKRLDTRKMAWE